MEAIDGDGLRRLLDGSRRDRCVLYAWTPGCGHCRAARRDLVELEPGLAAEGIAVLSLDASAVPEASLLRLVGVPTLLLFAGGRLRLRLTGYTGQVRLRAALERLRAAS